jgi:predicted transposase YbfD/YdcC
MDELKKDTAANSIAYYFSTLEDPRRTELGNFTHLLSDILLLVITGILCGCDKWETIHIFGESQEDWLKDYGCFDKGIPSIDTTRRVFSSIDPEKFNTCFISWAKHLSSKTKGEIIAIDGKTVRGAKFQDLVTPHIVSAFASENQLCLGQLKVDKKSNEITAIPALLKLLDLQDNIVTIDAMGCQTKIVEQIIEGGSNYIVAVKGNQPTLEKNIQDTMSLTKCTIIDVQESFGHGRIEKRTCSVFTNLNHIESKDKWRNLNSVIRITAEVMQKSSGIKTIEERFYISDISSAAIINRGIRSHWSVENNLHWSLDVTFQEDASKKRMGNQVENFNMLTKIVLSILKKDKSTKISLKNKRMKAAFDVKYRNNLMNIGVF